MEEQFEEKHVGGLTIADISPMVDEALSIIQEIPLSSICYQPNVVLTLEPSPTTPIWREHNYL